MCTYKLSRPQIRIESLLLAIKIDGVRGLLTTLDLFCISDVNNYILAITSLSLKPTDYCP
jgi:hypothetical protein